MFHCRLLFQLSQISTNRFRISISMSQNKLSDFLNTLREAAGGSLASSENRTVKRQKATKSLLDPSRLGNASIFGYTEINKFEHCARLLQKSIRTIVCEGPSLNYLRKVSSDETIDRFAKLEAKHNPLLQLVAKLKTNYLSKQLQIFDDILVNNVSVSESSVVPEHLVETPQESLENELDSEDFDIREGLPPLPKIMDPSLRLRVFQHSSTCANKTYLDDKEIVLSHNERLEFLGDSFLNTLVTYILYERFPTANEGQLSQIRSSLVNNNLLGEFSIAYGFEKHLRCNIDEEVLKVGRQKIFADVFEAYVGALAMERKFDLGEVEAWLKALMANKIAIASKEIRDMKHTDKDAKTELYSLIGTASLHPIYKVIESGNGFNTPFKVQCLMEDTVMGEGEAASLKDAGLQAAMSALTNKEMLEKYGRRRLETARSISEIKPQSTSKTNVFNGSTQFPLFADESVLPNKFAKNEAYAYFGKNLGLSPEYKIVFEEDSKRYRTELRLKDTAISVAYDTSKKNAMARAAAVILENKQLLHEIVSLVN